MNQEFIIVDTSALVAFFVGSETHHQAAQQYCLENPQKRWIILESVFDETVTWMHTKISSRASIQIGQILRKEHCYINLRSMKHSYIRNCENIHIARSQSLYKVLIH